MRLSVAWLWAIVIVVRLAYALLATQIDPFLRANPLHGDATQYDATAWRLASTGEYRLDKENATAPAYLYLMAGVYLFVGHEPAAVRLLNALLGLLTLWGLWRLTHQLVGERAANLALVLATFHPHLLMITGWLYMENLVLPLIVWGIYGLLFWRGGKGWAVSGVVLGLLALTRATFLPFAVLAVGWLLWRERTWRAPTLALITFLFTVLPYTLYISSQYNAFVPISLGSGYLALRANNEHADGGFSRIWEQELTIGGERKPTSEWLREDNPVARDRQAMRLALQWIKENPTQWLVLVGKKLSLTLRAFGLVHPKSRPVAQGLRLADGIYWIFLLSALYGLWRLRGEHPEFVLLILLLFGLTLLTVLLYAGGSRFILHTQPFLTLGAAGTIVALWVRVHTQSGAET
jgi:4-amino-4-deoxy-L-arabinose transferase-like glycosyltransferase